MSEKNPLTWAFAHRFAGRLWMILGPILLPPSLLLMILLPDGTEDSVGMAVMIILTVQIVILLATIAATEIALHRHFGSFVQIHVCLLFICPDYGPSCTGNQAPGTVFLNITLKRRSYQ